MSLKVDRVEEYLGQSISDPYGRKVGHIIGFYSDPDGNITSFEVSFGDSYYREIPVDMFKFDSNGIVMLPEWEYEAVKIERRLETVKKRLAALEELYGRKEIPQHSYEVFKKRLTDAIAKLSEESKKVKEELRKRIHDIEDQIVEIERAMTAVKMSYIGGEITEKPYRLAMEHLRRNLDILTREKESVKKHIDRIEALESIPSQALISAPSAPAAEEAAPQSQPMNVVVLES